MRRGLLLGAALGVVDAGVVVLLDWALRRHGNFDYGWYAYSPLTDRTAVVVTPDHVVNRWFAFVIVIGALVVVNCALAAGYVLVQRRAYRERIPATR